MKDHAHDYDCIPAAMLDVLGLLCLAAAGGFLSGAFWVDSQLAVGVLMGLFLGAMTSSLICFATARMGSRGVARATEARPAPTWRPSHPPTHVHR